MRFIKLKPKCAINESPPKLEDFYNEQDPRGCSNYEYNNYLKALESYNKNN